MAQKQPMKASNQRKTRQNGGLKGWGIIKPVAQTVVQATGIGSVQ